MPDGTLDWNEIRLVAFDVDGTLYDQRRLRLAMAVEMLRVAALRGQPRILSVIGTYRRLREKCGEHGTPDFERQLVTETAAACRQSEEVVRAWVAEWIHLRPLRHLRACRYPGVAELMTRLRQAGKVVGVVSDYPADDKLKAMALTVDHVVCATDPDVGILKPNPKALLRLMERTGTPAAATLMIGDRVDRDGLSAQRAGVRCLIRSRRRHSGWQTFERFQGPLFSPFLEDDGRGSSVPGR